MTTNEMTVGRLCIGGDWACAHGDFEALCFVARQLEAFVREPLHSELTALEVACLSDPGRAGEIWSTLKPRLFSSTEDAR